MRRAAKDAGRANGVKSAERAEKNDARHPEPEQDGLPKALMRAQADLETARLELQEHKRRSAQQALVASEALREARRERDELRGQLESLRFSESAAPKKK